MAGAHRKPQIRAGRRMGTQLALKQAESPLAALGVDFLALHGAQAGVDLAS
jgi:hypothetical protein